LQNVQSNEPMRPMSLLPSRQGVPIKINRFGLEPLPYQLKPIPQRFALGVSHHFHPDQTLNRRYGDLREETTVYPSPESTESTANQKVMPTEQYLATLGSIEESSTDPITEQNVKDYKEYEISDELSEEDDSSPTPVYISSRTTEREDIPSRSTTIKPSYLHRPDFASQLNNMYYNKPEVFQQMMDQFEEEDKV